MSTPKNPVQKAPPKRRPLVYFFVGIFNTIVDFTVYIIFVSFILASHDHRYSIAVAISGAVATCTAYLTHHLITWRDRPATRLTIVKFFLYNILAFLAIRPLIAAGLTFLTPFYQFTYSISSFLHLPFTFEFVRDTSIFVLLSAIMLFANYYAYSHFVFPEAKKLKKSKNHPPRVV